MRWPRADRLEGMRIGDVGVDGVAAAIGDEGAAANARHTIAVCAGTTGSWRA